MIKRARRPKVIKLDFSLDGDPLLVTSSINTSHKTSCSDDEINADWLYDTWEFNFLTKRVKKKKATTELDNFFVLREERQNPLVPRLDLSVASHEDLITPRSTETPTRKMTLQPQDSTFFYRSRKKSRPKSKPPNAKIEIYKFFQSLDEARPDLDPEPEIYIFSHSARYPSHEKERPFIAFSKQKSDHRRREKFRRSKGFRTLTSSIRRRKNSKVS